MQKGNISVQTDNIFPIIKKFLYADQDIFLRELISNAVDATSKLKILANRGELKSEIGDTTIEIILDKDAKTLTISDKGIGMTEEEVLKYLNQIAFSSAAEWLEKYKDEANIIGHFGLGFYSAFMVAREVEVKTKSWKEDSDAVVWTCNGSPEYSLDTIEKEQRGTDIILHISEDASEFLEKTRIEELLLKYCKFLPVPIKFGTRTITEKVGEGDDAKDETTEVDNIINNPNPAWTKNPSDLSDQDYKDFYRELFPMGQDPMFWIHLNIDYPFNLTGVLYFPKIGGALEMQKNKIHLYSNQVYVTDDVKEIVPEWLTLLHGVIDSPDIPLNVSRSYLQSDSNVRKITGYITKKVAEKLQEIFKADRKAYEDKWDDLNVFVKYGLISDEKFYDKALKFLLLKNTEGEFFTLEEYKEKVESNQKDKNGKLVYLYTNNPDEHHTYINTAKNAGYDVLVFDNLIDNHFIQHLEYKLTDFSFKRIDSDTLDHLIEKDEKRESVLSEKEQEKVKEVFLKVAGKEGQSVQLKALTPDEPPVQIIKPEFMRRMKEMQALNGMNFNDAFPDMYNVVVNTNHPVIAQKLLNKKTEENKEKLANYLLKLGLLNQNMLKGAELAEFINSSIDMVTK
jgi:molecular chaperone HtpG